MFTGLVQALGRVEQLAEEPGGRRFVLDWPGYAQTWELGESVAVNGCCLTVVEAQESRFTVQAGPETLARTNLGQLRVGDPVNLETSLQVGQKLGGHFVQGHVDTVAQLVRRREQEPWAYLHFRIDPAWTVLMVPKGSIAIDGVSLTLVEVDPDQFSVMLIPHTLAVTTLGRLVEGSPVNIEVDMLAKHVQKLVSVAALPTGSGGSD